MIPLFLLLVFMAFPAAAQVDRPIVTAGPLLLSYLRLPMLINAADGSVDSPLAQASFRAEWDSSLNIWSRVYLSAIMGAEYALPSLPSAWGTMVRGYLVGVSGLRLDVALGDGPRGPHLGMGGFYHLGTWTDAALAFQSIEAEIRFRLGLPIFPESWDLMGEIEVPLSFILRTDCLIPSLGLGFSFTRIGWPGVSM